MNNRMPSKELVENIRVSYPEGTRVELLSMSDPYTNLQRGDKGTVTFVDDIATIFVKWDNGSSLGVAYGEDSVRRLEPERHVDAAESDISPEYAHWIAKTESSRYRWTEDEIFRLNGRGAMYYHGGTDGIYLQIHKEGLVEFGKYEGAIPHIGDAMFQVLAEKQTKDFNEAFAVAMNWGGKQFLVDMFCGQDYLRSTELSTEQNYNMVDGVRNNMADAKADLTDGQTHDEIRELAPETLPDAPAGHADKPSLLGQLEQYRAGAADAPTSGPGSEPGHER